MKKYLKTPEEVVKALKAGKTVYSDCGEYRMIDGFIVYEGGSVCTINADLNLLESPFLKEAEPLKIEVGKFYKTRGDKKARCYYANEEVAYFTIDGKCSFFSSYLAGNCLSNNRPTEYEIIGPWEE